MNDRALPLVHVLEHAREALATDGRVGELGLVVHDAPDAGVIVVRGTVSTDDRKAAVVALVSEVLRAHGVERAVRDETEVAATAAPDADAELL